MEWKTFSMEWKWNGRKLPEWNMEKLSSIPCPCTVDNTSQIKYCSLQSKLACFFFKLNTISCFILSRDVEAEAGSGSGGSG